MIGSHRNQSGKPDGPIEVEDARRGDVLILHMNILHRSRPSQGSAPRRVLRVDYATAALPAPLTWSRPDQIGADLEE